MTIENQNKIDINFNFLSETPEGKDQDSVSPTLKKYNKLLWSKSLPGGKLFKLEYRDKKVDPYAYLYHKSDLGEFHLSCDTMIPSFAHGKRKSPGADKISDKELKSFESTINCTIGGKIIFPKNRIDGKGTINQSRGINSNICDRFDLTLECIRRHYQGKSSPLADTLLRYSDFFSLFESFRGYVEFFLLQDLVTDDFSSVNFFMPFDDFKTSPMPQDRESYIRYQKVTKDFVKKRSQRIQALLLGLALIEIKGEER